MVVGYIPRWFTCPWTVTNLSTNHFVATDRESNPWPRDRKSNVLTATQPSHRSIIVLILLLRLTCRWTVSWHMTAARVAWITYLQTLTRCFKSRVWPASLCTWCRLTACLVYSVQARMWSRSMSLAVDAGAAWCPLVSRAHGSLQLDSNITSVSIQSVK